MTPENKKVIIKAMEAAMEKSIKKASLELDKSIYKEDGIETAKYDRREGKARKGVVIIDWGMSEELDKKLDEIEKEKKIMYFSKGDKVRFKESVFGSGIETVKEIEPKKSPCLVCGVESCDIVRLEGKGGYYACRFELVKEKEKKMSDDSKVEKEEISLVQKICAMSLQEKVELSKSCQNLLLTGRPGTGKNYFADFIAKLTGRKFISTTCYRAMSGTDLFGFWQIKDGNCVWFDGPVTWAFKHAPSVVALHEIDEATNTEVEPIIMNLMDDRELRKIYLPNGEVLSNQDVMVIGTSNFASSELREALRDRFEMELPFDNYSKEQLEMIPRTRNFLENLTKKPTINTNPTHTFRRHRAFEKHSKALHPVYGVENAEKIAAFLCLQIPENNIEGFLQSLEVSKMTGEAETPYDDLMK